MHCQVLPVLTGSVTDRLTDFLQAYAFVPASAASQSIGGAYFSAVALTSLGTIVLLVSPPVMVRVAVNMH